MVVFRCKFSMLSLFLVVVVWLSMKIEGKPQSSTLVREPRQMLVYPRLPTSDAIHNYYDSLRQYYLQPIRASSDMVSLNGYSSPNDGFTDSTVSGRNFFGLANLFAPRQCPVCTCPPVASCPTYPSCAKCPTPPPDPAFATCANTVTYVSAAPIGTISLTFTAVTNCAYGIVAYPPNTRIQLACSTLSGSAVTAMPSGGTALVAGASPTSIATTSVVLNVAATSGCTASASCTLKCNWTAIP